MKLNPAFINRAPSSAFVAWVVALTSVVWIFWQVWGIEIMRTPWEDEILYVLPAVNWVKNGSFAVPQLGAFAGADIAWGWHVPGFSLGMAAWLLLFPLDLWSIRLFTLLPAVAANALLLWVAAKVGVIRTIWGLCIWICIIYFDKSIVSQSLTGRMEFHALLLLLAALCFLVFSPTESGFTRVATYTFASGFLFGLSAVFHPVTLYFAPTLAITALLSPCVRRNGVLSTAIIGVTAAVLPVATAAVWFHFAGPIAQQQFLLSVTGSSVEATLGSLRSIADTVVFVYRYQPAMILVLVLLVLAMLTQGRDFISNGWGRWRTPQRLLVAAVTGIICFVVAMLRGSSMHVNYYTILTMFVLLALIAAYALSQEYAHPGFRAFGVAVITILALNNVAFAAFKTYVVAINSGISKDKGLENFLVPLTHSPDKRYVLSPKLWLWAESRNLNWRVSYLTLVGQSPTTHDAYHESIFEWNPDLIILDNNDWPERQIAADELDRVGFEHSSSFTRVFTHRGRYSAGWDLQVYHITR